MELLLLSASLLVEINLSRHQHFGSVRDEATILYLCLHTQSLQQEEVVRFRKRFVLGYLLKSSQVFGGKTPAFCLHFTSASSARLFPYKRRDWNLQELESWKTLLEEKGKSSALLHSLKSYQLLWSDSDSCTAQLERRGRNNSTQKSVSERHLVVHIYGRKAGVPTSMCISALGAAGEEDEDVDEQEDENEEESEDESEGEDEGCG
ncbi:uncharacterized protein LOC115903366 [Camarhynchus parvulus]|uniref:uncharacterized protein LOC115903366 n=1 Tax=Geospiza parvula TaxID=87175 RepID=UPI0012381959|nr:uncharacterized protein LOC115903366 [Camarhynchus parvulus]